MSIKVMHLVWEYSQHSGGNLLTMLAIADHASDDGVAYPGIERLARKTRMDARHIYRILPRLERSAELTILHGAGPNGVNRYHINITLLRSRDTPDKLPPDKLPPDNMSGSQSGKQRKNKEIEETSTNNTPPDNMSPLTNCHLTFDGVECHPNHQEPSEEKNKEQNSPNGEFFAVVETSVSPSASPPPVSGERSRARKTATDGSDWPADERALYHWLVEQELLTSLATPRHYDWWARVSYVIGWPDTDWLSAQFAKMELWLQENPRRKPTPRGATRFIRTWLENAYDKERRSAQTKQAKEVHIHYNGRR